MKFRIAFIIILMMGLASSLSADENEAKKLFYQANLNYSSSNFKEVIINYEKILGLGYENGPLYYNLGNAYFKEGELGKAILNYRRAERFMPNDADLKSNLQLAYSLVKNKVSAHEPGFFAQAFYNFANLFTLQALAFTTWLIYLALCVSLVFFISISRLKKFLGYLSIILLALVLLFGLTLGLVFYQTRMVKRAVIIAPKVNCKFEPLKDATTFFSLSEGEEVEVLHSRNDWLKIRRADGKSAWVEKYQLEHFD